MVGFTNTCLELFDKVPVLDPILGSSVQEVYPITSLNESSIEFEYQTDRNVFLDLRETFLLVKISLDRSKRVKEETDETLVKKVTCVNNILHSLFSNCEVFVNNTQIYNSNNLYPHKAFISNEFNGAHAEYKGLLQCHGYQFESSVADTTKGVFLARSNALVGGDITLYGKLSVDFFTTEKLLLPKTKLRLKLIRSRPNFYLLTEEKNLSINIKDVTLFTRRVTVQENMQRYIENHLLREPAMYHYLETDARTFIIPKGQNQFIQENVFNNAPIRRVCIAMNSNSAFTGTFDENPFHYRKFGLREIRIVRGNQPIVLMDTTKDARVYVSTMKAMKYNDETPSIPFDKYKDHYMLVFDLTSLQDAADHIYYPELVGESLRLELYFEKPLEQVTEIIVLGERLSTVKIDRFGVVTKNS